MATTITESPRIRGTYPAKYKLFAADGVEVTPDMIGRKVEFQSYEGYQNHKTLKGVGVIHSIDYQYGTVTVEMPFERSVYGRDNFLVDRSNLLRMSGDYQFERPGKPAGRYLDYISNGFQFDYPTSWQHIFKILPE